MRNVITVTLLSVFLSACGNSSTEVSSATAEPSPVSVESSRVDQGEAKQVNTAADQKADEALATVTEKAQAAPEKATTSAAAVAARADKPYQLVDGKISSNAIEGWKTYNGGGCGVCHGKGGMGGVGPNLSESLTTKLSEDDFKNIVIHGKPGTLMRPNNANKRVMDNLDNLYAYLVARADGVLGTENLIKFPLGKKE